MRLRTVFLSFLLTVAALSFAGEAFALNFGMLQVKPFLDFKTVYDDNVFATRDNKEEDTYFLISPGLLLQLGRNPNRRLELEYRADIFRYTETGDVNDAEDHNLRFTADINPEDNGIFLNVKELGARAHEPRSQQNFLVSTTLNRFWSNDFNIEAGYAFSRLKVSAGYQNFYLDFSNPENKFRNRLDNAAKADIYYRVFAKTSVVVEGVYRNIDHFNDDPVSNSLDSEEYWVMGGVTWKMTDKSKGTIKGGYEWKNFRESGGRNFRKPVFQVEIEHNFTPKTAVVLRGVRQANETDDPTVNYYTTTGGSAAIFLRPITKIEISPYGSFTENRYSGDVVAEGDVARRKDYVWTAGLDFKYNLNKWIAISIGYQHTKRNSNLTFYDYTDNLGYGSIKVTI